MAAGSSAQEVPKPTIIRDWDNTGRCVLHLLLYSSPGVCSWPQLHTGHGAGTTAAGAVWLLLWPYISLTDRWAPLPRAVCGLTFWNIKDFLRNREVKIVQLREKHLRGMPVSVHVGMGLCMCAHMGLKWKQRSKPPWPHTTW